jgi:predicted aldo/keto reductase-like oxidoreductase
MKRRTFFHGALAGAAGTLPATARAGTVPTRKFGRTGVDLTIVGLAAARLQLIDLEGAKEVIRRSYDLGVNYFDNARSYGDGLTEEYYGAGMEGFRKEVFVTSKSVGRTREAAEKDLHASLKAMRTDYLDLWQIHSVATMDDIERIFAPGGAIEAFEAAKQAGKCRFIGFTGHTAPDLHLEMLKRYEGYDSILMPLNVADPHYLSFEKEVLPVAVKRGIGIQAMKVVGVAQLLRSFSIEETIRYVLSLPVHCATMGANTLGQIEDDVRIAQRFAPLGDEEMAALRKRSKRISGPRLENWKRQPENAALRGAVYRGD